MELTLLKQELGFQLSATPAECFHVWSWPHVLHHQVINMAVWRNYQSQRNLPVSDLLTTFHVGTLKHGYFLDDNLLFFDRALVIPSKDLQSQILATWS
jgi:hypothetical protein